ncbi:hypothetical protein EMIHUDRAFT_438618 [Emiliania huxleyi CCMP1516]|uniref:Uncharacterized protein n=2 Tax=Emiliania huxleyi TaxID=2903 RepID=A0A0D3I6P8_EMIH1|nr:hypothetical protein EMIHUDRAFT_438618 [Emiliania huxleyi CCMP1516]EOD06933.1 hypothetical protein EMIHUDRAFT_438618 [Emiliania huxleyi CCMP1516]|eukprot:XP_005759362.1 hypothetical protein EMIHUDRAFT_438618 [Emiliania huxleyi CCMP1516]
MLALLSTAMLYSAAWHSSAGVFRHVVLHPTHSGPAAAVTMASTDDENEMPYEGPPLPAKVCSLLMQCAIQAQLSYYNEFKNEMRARWLESFLGHAHLRVERTGGRKSSGYPLYRGLSDGLRCSWTEYLQTMLRGKVERYEVRYKIGTADAADTAGSAASAAAAAGAGSAGDASEAPWAAASASRAANPYLKQSGPQYKEYSEVVEPRRVAQGLMSICRQLALEWSSDLLSVSSESLYLGDVCGSGGGGDGGGGRADPFDGSGVGGVQNGGDAFATRDVDCSERQDVAPSTPLGEYLAGNVTVDALCMDPRIALPPALYASTRAASGKWSSDFSEASSPFRASNLDLLQRACTREAALSALRDLDEEQNESNSHAASAEWLREKLDEWLPRFESPRRHQLAGLFVLELLSSSPQPRQLSSGGLGMTEPALVASRVLAHREAIARDWAAAVAGSVPTALQELLREDLEEQLNAESEERPPPLQ